LLHGRVAVVTGAGRGIGQATAVALAIAGVAKVGLVARTAEQLGRTAQLVREAGAEPIIVPADLIDVTRIPELTETLLGRLGPVNVLINNAGMVAPLGPSLSLNAGDMLDALRLNTVAPVLLTAGLMPGMIDDGWGRVVNVSSGIVGNPANMIGGSTYAATKAALEAQTISIAAEYAETGVTVNAYRPGGVDTAMQGWIRSQDPERIGHALHERFTASHESGTLLTPEQSGQALVAHLGSDETGRVWDVTDAL
jgi:NAD(P)-dependent dehydrogenase (short-subunit alcohol dehydrogenase family)